MTKIPFGIITKKDVGVLDAVLMAVMVMAWAVSLIAALIALGAVLSMFT